MVAGMPRHAIYFKTFVVVTDVYLKHAKHAGEGVAVEGPPVLPVPHSTRRHLRSKLCQCKGLSSALGSAVSGHARARTIDSVHTRFATS